MKFKRFAVLRTRKHVLACLSLRLCTADIVLFSRMRVHQLVYDLHQNNCVQINVVARDVGCG